MLLAGLAFSVSAHATTGCFDREDHARDPSSSLPQRVAIADDSWTLDGLVCAVQRRRAIGPTRDYVDLICTDGHMLQFDVNRLGKDRILLNTRPLGSALFFDRQACASSRAGP